MCTYLDQIGGGIDENSNRHEGESSSRFQEE
jgi:hypothetical protein